MQECYQWSKRGREGGEKVNRPPLSSATPSVYDSSYFCLPATGFKEKKNDQHMR